MSWSISFNFSSPPRSFIRQMSHSLVEYLEGKMASYEENHACIANFLSISKDFLQIEKNFIFLIDSYFNAVDLEKKVLIFKLGSLGFEGDFSSDMERIEEISGEELDSGRPFLSFLEEKLNNNIGGVVLPLRNELDQFYFEREDLYALLRLYPDVLFLIDELYSPFPFYSFRSEVERFPNLWIIGSFEHQWIPSWEVFYLVTSYRAGLEESVNSTSLLELEWVRLLLSSSFEQRDPDWSSRKLEISHFLTRLGFRITHSVGEYIFFFADGLFTPFCQFLDEYGVTYLHKGKAIQLAIPPRKEMKRFFSLFKTFFQSIECYSISGELGAIQKEKIKQQLLKSKAPKVYVQYEETFFEEFLYQEELQWLFSRAVSVKEREIYFQYCSVITNRKEWISWKRWKVKFIE